jgi:parvulin-like peptidyl-prolyl isomerase
MRAIKLSLIAVFVLAALGGCGRRGLIYVNGDKIGKDEFYARLERVPVQTIKGGQRVTVPAGQYVIEQIIGEQIVQQLAKDEHVAPTDAQIDAKLRYFKKTSGGAFLTQLRQQGMSQDDWKHRMRIQQSVINLIGKGIKVSDDEAKQTYNKSIAMFTHPAAVRISVIIDKDKAKIDKAYKLLQQKQDFSTVAMTLSEDKATAPGGGVVGWLSMNMDGVPIEIRKAAFAAPVGGYSKPIFIPDKRAPGWIIVKADQTRKATTEDFDTVKVLLKEDIAVRKANRKQFEERLRKFIAKSNIKVNAERYKNLPEMMKKSATVPANLEPSKLTSPTQPPKK